MRHRIKLWSGLGSAILAAGGVGLATQAEAKPMAPREGVSHHALLLAQAGGDGEGAHVAGEGEGARSGGEGGGARAAGEGEGARSRGEGEGARAAGEGEGRSPRMSGEGEGQRLTPASGDVVYLWQLALVRGHLDVAMELYEMGRRDAARTHAKHPGDELYRDLEPAFEARGVSGFADALGKVASLAQADAPAEEVKSAYGEVLSGVAAAEAAVAAAVREDPETAAALAVALVRIAAEEFDIAVENGKLVNAHEYQDALGFVRTARYLTGQAAATGRGREALAEIQAELDGLLAKWPAVVPAETIETEPSAVYGAAARMEISALSMR